jgi:hypothetical protein
MPIGNRGIELGDADDPGTRFFAITPDDDADIEGDWPRAILVDQDCTVVVVGANDDTEDAIGLPLAGGVWHPGILRRIMATGTTGGIIIRGQR